MLKLDKKGPAVRTWSDIDLSFEMNPLTGDVSAKTDENAVKQSIRNIVLTVLGEYGFWPDFGSQVTSSLFAPFDNASRAILRRVVREALENHEPRISVQFVECDWLELKNRVDITVDFVIINSDSPVTYTFTAFRTR